MELCAVHLSLPSFLFLFSIPIKANVLSFPLVGSHGLLVRLHDFFHSLSSHNLNDPCFPKLNLLKGEITN